MSQAFRDTTLERVEAALAKVTVLVLEDARYAPIFERLLEESEKLERKEDIRARARAIVMAKAVQAKCSGTGNASRFAISNRSASVSASP